MPKRTKVALVTGATKGIGYYVGREIVKRMAQTTTIMTSRENVNGFSAMLGMELGAGARDRSKFIKMDVRDVEAVELKKTKIVKDFGGLDILVNNAGIYKVPDLNPAVFKRQVHEVMSTNYWGTKNVIEAFFPHFKPHSRIVNITSNLGHIVSENCAEEHLKAALRIK